VLTNVEAIVEGAEVGGMYDMDEQGIDNDW